MREIDRNLLSSQTALKYGSRLRKTDVNIGAPLDVSHLLRGLLVPDAGIACFGHDDKSDNDPRMLFVGTSSSATSRNLKRLPLVASLNHALDS
jgi:hypothetical protein